MNKKIFSLGMDDEGVVSVAGLTATPFPGFEFAVDDRVPAILSGG